MEYNVNKGIGKSVEFKGLKSQYLFIFAGGSALGIRGLCHYVYDRHRPMDMYRFRRYCRLGIGLVYVPAERAVRGIRSNEGHG